jgi:hypothetical protein
MFDPIYTSFQSALVAGGDAHQPLAMLLRALNARAVGLWRCRGDHLEQVGFRAVADMPQTTRQEFAAATRRVSLSETGLGIVKAVVSRKPAVAAVAGNVELGQSAGWLARFEARQSVAMPVQHHNAIVGVLASSSAQEIHAGDAHWELLGKLAAALGPYLIP